jgi:uncharacterized protein (DUF736 family)
LIDPVLVEIQREEPLGYTGKVDTLATKADIAVFPNEDKEKENQPDFIVMSGKKEIGVAWDRPDD